MIEARQVVYISGPMSFDPVTFNKPAFNAMEKFLKEAFGCVILNPARHPDGLEYETYMEYAMIDVKNSHVIVLLKGWHYSPGAQTERAHAVKLGKNIIKAEKLLQLAAKKLNP